MNKSWKVYLVVMIGAWIGISFIALYGWFKSDQLIWCVLTVVCYMMAFVWLITGQLSAINEKIDTLQNDNKVKRKEE